MTSLARRVRDLWSLPAGEGAVEHRGRWVTWGALTAQADALREPLGTAGLDEGVPMVVVLDNRPGVVATVLGAIADGRRVRFVNGMQAVERLTRDLASLAPSVVVTGEGTAETVGDIESTARLVLVEDTGAVRVLRDGVVPTEVVLPEDAKVAGALELFTSGTTGPAKRITLTVAQVEASLSSVLDHYSAGSEQRRPSSPALVSTPMAHIGGLFGVLQSFASGRPFVLLDRFAVEPWVDAVRRHRPKATGLPPAALRMVLDARVPREHLSSLRAMNAGTAPLDPDLVDEFLEVYGVPILNVYGATEFAGAVAGWTLPLFRQWWERKRGSAGKPQPGVGMRVVGPDGEDLGADADGVLEIRAAQTGRDGWLRTTDRARLDSDGFLWILGRADDVIIRGGFKVDPSVVKAALERHPDVVEAAICALPDPRLGSVPAAAVQLAPGAWVDPEALRDSCRSELTAYEVPARVLVVDALPRTPSMKVSAVGLRALFDAADDALVGH